MLLFNGDVFLRVFIDIVPLVECGRLPDGGVGVRGQEEAHPGGLSQEVA